MTEHEFFDRLRFDLISALERSNRRRRRLQLLNLGVLVAFVVKFAVDAVTNHQPTVTAPLFVAYLLGRIVWVEARRARRRRTR